jgi:hypothetical protein
MKDCIHEYTLVVNQRREALVLLKPPMAHGGDDERTPCVLATFYHTYLAFSPELALAVEGEAG